MIISELPCIEVETSNEGHAARQKKMRLCAIMRISSVLFKKMPQHTSPHRIMQQMKTGHANVSTVMFILVEFHTK